MNTAELTNQIVVNKSYQIVIDDCDCILITTCPRDTTRTVVRANILINEYKVGEMHVRTYRRTHVRSGELGLSGATR